MRWAHFYVFKRYVDWVVIISQILLVTGIYFKTLMPQTKQFDV